MPPVELDVTRIEQKPGLCGAATAQMILHFKGLTGTSEADQDALFTAIQNNTAGARPLGAVINTHDCPSWPKQECTRCPGVAAYTCWCTYPPALEATLNQRGPAIALTSHNNDQAAGTAVLRSVDFNYPPAVLVKNGLHWLTVAGYNPAVNAGDGVVIDGREVTDIFVRNPTVGAANQLVTIETWMSDYQAPAIQCGPFLNLIVVIGATANTGIAGPAPPTNVRITRRKKPKKPPRPRQPKKPKPKPTPRPKPPKPPRPPKRRSRRG